MKKKILITGVSEGIGRALAFEFASQGYQISGVARNQERMNSLAQELGGSCGRFICADLGTRHGVQTLQDEIQSMQYDVFINNAGFGNLNDFLETSPAQIEGMIHLNIQALVMLSQAYLKSAKTGDALINISSTLSFLPMPAQTVYAATKAFVTSFTESLWFSQKKRGIHVMAFCPGITTSQFNERSGGKSESLPPALTESAEDVAKRIFNALRSKSGPTVVSGWKNQILVFFARLLPRRSLVTMMGKVRQ